MPEQCFITDTVLCN